MTRTQASPPATIYVAALFAMGYTDFYIFLIPLYGLSLGMSAGEIGMLVGGRSLLAVFLSIHVGSLMDHFGTRRVTLFFVWTAMALAPVFPLVHGSGRCCCCRSSMAVRCPLPGRARRP